MDNSKYDLLVEVTGRWRADVIENYLKAEGIEVIVVQETVSDLFTSTYSPVRIYVPKQDLEQARDLLHAFEKTKDS